MFVSPFLSLPNSSLFLRLLSIYLSMSQCLLLSNHLSTSVCLTICLSLSQCLYLLHHLSISVWLAIILSLFLFGSICICISIYLYFKVFVCPQIYHPSLTHCFRVSHQTFIIVSVYPSVSVFLNIYLAIFLCP